MAIKMDRILAAVNVLLIIPAVLFLTSVVARKLSIFQPEPAGMAHQIVMWYSARIWTLWVLLVTLPMAVFITGGAALLNSRGGARGTRAEHSPLLTGARLTMGIIMATTGTSCLILVVVILHMLAN